MGGSLRRNYTKLTRTEEDRRIGGRPAGRPEIGLAASQGEARLLARSIAERSPSGTGRS